MPRILQYNLMIFVEFIESKPIAVMLRNAIEFYLELAEVSNVASLSRFRPFLEINLIESYIRTSKSCSVNVLFIRALQSNRMD